LLQLLARGAQSREVLKRRLRLDTRGFYRDLETLRHAGIGVTFQSQRYALEESARSAMDALPFPDPGLTLGEALQLAKGRSAAHRKLKKQLARIVE
jgi:hypothetical protein